MRTLPGVSESLTGTPTTLILPAVGMFLLDDHLARDHLLVGDHLTNGVHRRGGYAGLDQQLHPVIRRLCRVDLRDDLVQRVAH